MKNNRANTSATQRTCCDGDPGLVTVNVVGDEGRSHRQQLDGIGDRRGLGLSGPAQHRMYAGEGHRGDERLGNPVVGVRDAFDGIGDRGEEALRLAAHQGLDKIVPARVATIGRHPRHTRPPNHIFDRDALQPNGGRLRQRGIQDALTGAVGRLVDAAACTRAADHLDNLGVDHDAATSVLATPAARSLAICR